MSTDRVTQIASRFERAILAGELAPGDRLPSEREISQQMGVSRSVVREALGRLTSLGLVKSLHGSGTRVAQPSAKQVAIGYQRLIRHGHTEFKHLNAVRLPLETTIAEMAAVRRTEAHLEALTQTQSVMADRERPLEEYIKADLDFHAILADATENPLFAVVLAPMQELIVEKHNLTLGRFGSEVTFREHGLILDAIRAGDPAAASAAMREHLTSVRHHLMELAQEGILAEKAEPAAADAETSVAPSAVGAPGAAETDSPDEELEVNVVEDPHPPVPEFTVLAATPPTTGAEGDADRPRETTAG